MQGTRDLGVVVPGLTFASQGALAQPAIRGIQSIGGSAGTDTPVAIYVDGFYQPNQVGNFFDLPDVAQIEVLKGPQGTLFGRNATGGAITIKTLDPSLDSVTGSVTISDGAFIGRNAKTANNFEAKGFISVPLVADKLAISASGFISHTNGFMTNDLTGARYGRIDSYLGRLKILFAPTENLRFILAGSISNREDEGTTTLLALNGVTAAAAKDANGNPIYPDAVIPSKPWHTAGENGGGSFASAKSKSITLTAEGTIPGAGTITSRTGYSYVTSPLMTDVDNSFAPSCLAVVACINYGYNSGPNKTFQQELTFASDDFGKFSFVAGAFYYHDKVEQTQNINPPILQGRPVVLDIPGVVFLQPQVITKAYAGFGELYFDPTDKLRLIAGVRYSHESKSATELTGAIPNLQGGAWSAWTPRLSALYRATPRLNVFATYSRGFKSGVPNVNFPAPAAEPEKLDSVEVGLKYGSPIFDVNLSAFHYNYNNLQLQTFQGIAVVNQNAAKAKLYGFDLDSTVRLTSSFQVRVAASWMPHANYVDYKKAAVYDFPLTAYGLTAKTIDASGYRMLKAPKLTGSVTGRYEHELSAGKFDASVTLYHASTMNWEVLGRVQTRGYWTLSGQMGIELKDTPVKLSLYGRNLTNRAYITGAIVGGISDSVLFAKPREIGLSAQYKF